MTLANADFVRFCFSSAPPTSLNSQEASSSSWLYFGSAYLIVATSSMMGGARYNLVRPGEERCWQCYAALLLRRCNWPGAMLGGGLLSYMNAATHGPGDWMCNAAAQ